MAITHDGGGRGRQPRVGDEFVKAKANDREARTRVEELVAAGDPAARRWLQRWMRQGCRDAKLKIIALAEEGDEGYCRQLMELARERDNDAWVSIHNTAERIAGSLLRRMTGANSPEDNAELVEDAMEFLLGKLDGNFDMNQAAKYGGLLHMVIQRMVMKWFRERASTERFHVGYAEPALRLRSRQLVAVVDELYREFGVTARDLELEVGRLTKLQQEVVDLIVRGQTVRQVAKYLNISTGKVSGEWKAAVAAMRQRLTAKR